MVTKFKMRGKDKTNGTSKKVVIKFDITMLNSFIGYIFTPKRVVSRKALKNMKTLFDVLDDRMYEGNDKMEARLNFINRALKAKLDEGMENESVILNYCRTDVETKETEEIITNLEQYKRINFKEIEYIGNAIQSRLKYYFIQFYKDDLYDLMERIESGDYDSYTTINEQFLSVVRELIAETRKTNLVDTANSLSLADESYEQDVEDIAEKLLDPARVLKCGIKKQNAILGGGYFAKRLYMYIGLPAGFKSGTLLKTCRDIKKYNKGVPAKKPGMRKTVLLVTMENSVEESVERLFNMTVTDENIRNFTPKQIVEMLKEQGEMKIEDDDDINIIIRYHANRSISTADLYTIIEDIEDDNGEVIALVLDYIKRIRPAEPGKDEKEELKNVTNELKSLASDKDIPVISAHQLNRAAASTVDAGMGTGKEDLTRFLGNSNVGSAWEIIENSDWCCIINVEQKRGTNNFYLTFKRTKMRYRDPNPNEMGYFNHPFEVGNRIRLIDDMDLDVSLSEDSLATDFDGVVDIMEKRGKRTARERDIIDDESIQELFVFGSTHKIA